METQPPASEPVCPVCLWRRHSKELRLESIKSQILSKLRLKEAPNITREVVKQLLPKAPPLQQLLDLHDFQGDSLQPDEYLEEDEYHATTETVISMAQESQCRLCSAPPPPQSSPADSPPPTPPNPGSPFPTVPPPGSFHHPPSPRLPSPLSLRSPRPVRRWASSLRGSPPPTPPRGAPSSPAAPHPRSPPPGAARFPLGVPPRSPCAPTCSPHQCPCVVPPHTPIQSPGWQVPGTRGQPGRQPVRGAGNWEMGVGMAAGCWDLVAGTGTQHWGLGPGTGTQCWGLGPNTENWESVLGTGTRHWGLRVSTGD